MVTLEELKPNSRTEGLWVTWKVDGKEYKLFDGPDEKMYMREVTKVNIITKEDKTAHPEYELSDKIEPYKFE